MHADRIALLGEEIRQYVFHLLDAEPDMDGMDAGMIASEVLGEFYRAMLRTEERSEVIE